MIGISRKLLNAYLCGVPLSFIYHSYDSAKNASFIYQNNMLNDYEKKSYRTKESYMRFKMFAELPPNFFLSLFGPVSVPILFIPKIIEHIEK
jgi:hypothetical protein